MYHFYVIVFYDERLDWTWSCHFEYCNCKCDSVNNVKKRIQIISKKVCEKIVFSTWLDTLKSFRLKSLPINIRQNWYLWLVQKCHTNAMSQIFHRLHFKNRICDDRLVMFAKLISHITGSAVANLQYFTMLFLYIRICDDILVMYDRTIFYITGSAITDL